MEDKFGLFAAANRCPATRYCVKFASNGLSRLQEFEPLPLTIGNMGSLEILVVMMPVFQSKGVKRPWMWES